MKRKGFTLIELLAVIVILAIIALIAVPIILNVIDTAKEGAFKDSVDGIVDATEKKIALDMVDGKTVANTYVFTNGEESSNELSKYIKGKKPDSAKIKVDSNRKIIFAIWDEEIKMCAYKTTPKGEIKYKKNVESGSACNELVFEGAMLKDNSYYNGSSFFSYYFYNPGDLYDTTVCDGNIEKVAFVNYIDTSKAVVGYGNPNNPPGEHPFIFDVSAAGDNSIVMWAEASNTSNPSYPRYTIYIGSEKTIYAPEDSSGMFSGMSIDDTIDFTNFDTSKVTNMSEMFWQCFGPTILDLSGFDTSKVTDMSRMFYETDYLTTIYVGPNWVINEGTDTTDMFSECGTDTVTLKS